MRNLDSQIILNGRSVEPACAEEAEAFSRLGQLDDSAGGPRPLAERLIALAARGLPQSFADRTFAQTVRAVPTRAGTSVRLEGQNLRYAAIAALGTARLDNAAQRQIMGGESAAEFARSLVTRAEASQDTGALALVAWAAAEIAGIHATRIFERLRVTLAGGAPISTVECSWTLTAALAARHLAATDDLSVAAAKRLMDAQGPGGLFPHMLPASAMGRLRAHVGCFADQVYPIQALARFAVAMSDAAALAAADACAARICARQGSAGQWWWHYDARNGRVVEGYPVYSVHQHAMAPMALLDLFEAGGGDYREAIVAGLRWLEEHPEVEGDLISDGHALIWRKVGRREPRKAARSLSAVTTALRAGLRFPGLDLLFPPSRIDFECRPYELGWLLYAWLAGGVVDRLRTGAVSKRPQPAPQTPEGGERPVIFGLRLDAMTMSEVLARCRDALASRSPLLIGVVNAAKVVRLHQDPILRESLLDCDLLLADGQSVVWASKLFGRPVPERVAGIDLFQALLQLADREGRSIYLLGARPEVLRRLEARLRERFPGLRIAGSRDGYFPDSAGAEIAEDIRRSGADMLFLGMSSPKKENFLAAFQAVLGVPIMHGVGGSFDVLAGLTRRAPLAWQRIGLEWAFRLLQEPRRMWRRYLTTNLGFVGLAIRELVRPSPALLSMRGAMRVNRFETLVSRESSSRVGQEALR